VPQLLFYEAISLPIIIFQHANIRIPAGIDRFLRTVIVTPWMHWVHHSHWQPETDSNYSSVLSVWDRLFGSFRMHPRPWEIRLGLDGWKDFEWRSTLGMLKAPWTHRDADEETPPKNTG
jgi:sterol desaturase/sphingolipid hydroxylase (fatty acid hydroxylase superfamily)